MSLVKIEEGQTYPTREGGEVKVLEYISSENVIVEHQGIVKYTVRSSSVVIRRGNLKDRYRRSICKVGYIGIGAYSSAKRSKTYKTWVGVIERCYLVGSDGKHRYPSYADCSVSEEWHNFQNFAEWYEAQEKGEGWQIDKDILVVGNRIYSKETCCVVPSQINTLTNNNTPTGKSELPVGVATYRGRFQAKMRMRGVKIGLGTFDTKEEAHERYCECKYAHIRDLIENEYAYLREDIKKALLNWRVR